MNTDRSFPLFHETFPELNQFLLGLVSAYDAGKIRSRADLAEKVKAYFTPERMEQMEAKVPGWKKMASCAGGITLVHVMCVFLGLFMLPEYQALLPAQKQIVQWTVLFHDLGKEADEGKRDPIHAFRSAAMTAKRLTDLGFPVTPEFKKWISAWSELTSCAIKKPAELSEPIQNNEKLPEILAGVERLFGTDTPAALIIKSVLLHMSIDAVVDWPQAAPLTEAEIETYVSKTLAALLKVLMLADNEGWVLFSPESRAVQRSDTLNAFEKIEHMRQTQSLS